MFHQKVQKVNSDVSLQQQNQKFSPQPRNDLKPVPLPLTPDGKVDISRFPTSDWIKNDPMIRRWAREDAAAAAAKSSNPPDVSTVENQAANSQSEEIPLRSYRNSVLTPSQQIRLDRFLTSDLTKIDPVLSRWAQEAAAKSSTTPDVSTVEFQAAKAQSEEIPLPSHRDSVLTPGQQIRLDRFLTSDLTKIDPVLSRWAQEEAAKSSDTQKTAPSSIQAKLTVSTPGDKYELEADAMAAKVMAMPHTAIEPQQKAPNPTNPSVQRAVNEDKTVSTQLENRIQNATGGSPLPSDIRSFMEPRFGVDFSEIRVHTDSNAAAMCKEVGAKAFAVGNRIYYGAEYSPGNNELTAHELTHTIQQGATKRLTKQIRQQPASSPSQAVKKITPDDIPERLKRIPLNSFEQPSPTKKLNAKQFTPDCISQKPNRISLKLSEILTPKAGLTAKKFTQDSLAANFNKFSPEISEKQVATNRLQGRTLPQTAQEQSRSVSQTNSQTQRNPVKDFVKKQLENLMGHLGPAANKVIEILQSTQGIADILINPNKRQAFLSNLVKAIQTGFQNFSSNFAKHLQVGLISWLTGALGSGITIPNELNATGFISLILQVLDINYARVRSSLKKALGNDDNKVSLLEKRFTLVSNLARNINGGLVKAVQDMMANLNQSVQQLQQTVMESIRTWVIEEVVKKAVQRLVAILTPLGAVLNALDGIYKTISFFIEQGDRMLFVVKAIQASLNNIAGGQVGAAAEYIEQTLANSLSLTINFLAKLVGVDQVGQRVRAFIERVRTKVQKVIDQLVEKLVKESKGLLEKVGVGSQKAAPVNRPAGQAPNQGSAQQPKNSNPANAGSLTAKLKDREIGEAQNFKADGESHRLWIQVGGNRKPILMLASDPKPLVEFLKRNDVQKVKKSNTASESRVKEAQTLAEGITYDAEKLIEFLTQNKTSQAEIEDEEIEKDMRQLAEHLKGIFSKLNNANLEIAQSIFGDRPFSPEQLRSLLSHLSDADVSNLVSKWKKTKTNTLYSNENLPGIPYRRRQYCFCKNNLPEGTVKTPTENAAPKKTTPNAERIKYYEGILISAGIDPSKWPSRKPNAEELTEGDLKAYRQQMRNTILDSYGSSIESLDSRVLKQIKHPYVALKGEIFRLWVTRHFPNVTEVGHIVFKNFTRESGETKRVEADLMQGNNIMIEAKAYHENSDKKTDQMKDYNAILKKIANNEGITPIINKKERPDIRFTKIKYVFSNKKAKGEWEGLLRSNIDKNFLEIWAPGDPMN